MPDLNERSVILTLSVPPSVEDAIVDWLLAREETLEFTSQAVHAHGGVHHRLSVAEQVTGRRRRIEFRIELRESSIEPFVASLSAAFLGADIRYFATPTLALLIGAGNRSSSQS
jgi:hypothetical protein